MGGCYAERERSQCSSRFHIVQFTLAEVTAPGYRRAQAVAIISGSARLRFIRQSGLLLAGHGTGVPHLLNLIAPSFFVGIPKALPKIFSPAGWERG